MNGYEFYFDSEAHSIDGRGYTIVDRGNIGGDADRFSTRLEAIEFLEGMAEPADSLLVYMVAEVLIFDEAGSPSLEEVIQRLTDYMLRRGLTVDGIPTELITPETVILAQKKRDMCGGGGSEFTPLQRYSIWQLMSHQLDSTRGGVDDFEVAGYLLVSLLHEETLIGNLGDNWPGWNEDEGWAPNPWPDSPSLSLVQDVARWIRATWPPRLGHSQAAS